MRLKDDLSGADWQRRRNGEVFGAKDVQPVLEPLSDDMPMEAWQQARNRQAGLGARAEARRVGLSPAAPKADVDWEFIRNTEGSRADMYVPTDMHGRALDKSGPTIGKGVDLGQHGLGELKAWRLNAPLQAKLTPYLGRKRQEALAFVEANPLVLSAAEQEELNSAVRKQQLGDLVRKFDSASQVGAFSSLPRNTQTAIADLYFQYGTGAPTTSTPNYWAQITSGDWEAAHRNLMAFGDKYGPRRQLEAGLLHQDIAAGKLPRKPR